MKKDFGGLNVSSRHTDDCWDCHQIKVVVAPYQILTNSAWITTRTNSEAKIIIDSPYGEVIADFGCIAS